MTHEASASGMVVASFYFLFNHFRCRMEKNPVELSEQVDQMRREEI